MALPSRSLKPAIDCLARVTSGFWPVMMVRSFTAPSSRDCCWVARPTPMLMTIFSSVGTIMMLGTCRVSFSWARISLS